MNKSRILLFPFLTFFTYLCIALYVIYTGHLHEDAYILYIFSESFANGNGIAYYPGGPHAEGATDFLWMMLLGAANYFGADVAVSAAVFNGLGLGAICFFVVNLLEKKLDGKKLLLYSFLFSIIILFSPIAIASFAGFSTSFYCAFIAFLFIALYERRYSYILYIPLVSIIIGLIRPDGVIIGVIASLIGLFFAHTYGFLRRYVLISIFSCFIGILYFFWRYTYFGNLLPLPLYVKGASFSGMPGIIPHIYWALSNGFLGLLTILLIVFSKERVRFLIAAIPIFTLFIALIFATQSQNVSFRFQAPGTLLLIFASAVLITEVKISSFVDNKTTLWLSLIVFLLFGALTTYVIQTRSMILILQDKQYINYFPYYLDKKADEDIVIALTEAGRFAYWMSGSKYDLVGLNTTYTAIEKASPDYLEKINPDLIFIHTAGTADTSSFCKENFCKISMDQLSQSVTTTESWDDINDGVGRAPLVFYDYIYSTDVDYQLYTVKYGGSYGHLYAVKKDSSLLLTDFESELSKSFVQKNSMSYFEMKNGFKSIFSR